MSCENDGSHLYSAESEFAFSANADVAGCMHQWDEITSSTWRFAHLWSSYTWWTRVLVILSWSPECQSLDDP